METRPIDPISEDEVRLTAQLSELLLDDKELPRLTEALKTMLGHFEVVSRVVGEGKNTASPVEKLGRLSDCRPDERLTQSHSEDDRKKLVEVAPDFEDEFFFVPRIK